MVVILQAADDIPFAMDNRVLTEIKLMYIRTPPEDQCRPSLLSSAAHMHTAPTCQASVLTRHLQVIQNLYCSLHTFNTMPC